MSGPLTVPIRQFIDRLQFVQSSIQMENCSPEPRLPSCLCHLRQDELLQAIKDFSLVLRQSDIPLLMPHDGSMLVVPSINLVLSRRDVTPQDIAPDEIRIVRPDQVRRQFARTLGIASGY